ncbi:NADPH-flavin oxidoreductase, partial [Streptomyces hygroscopicus]|nr:NADPH-flavin oxidoreductase [Streptomyces hygroscopicus]
MGHAGMAATAVRYLRSVGAGTAAGPVEALPRPELRAVGANERAPVDPGEFRRVLGNFATGITVITAPAAGSEGGADGAPAADGADGADGA